MLPMSGSIIWKRFNRVFADANGRDQTEHISQYDQHCITRDISKTTALTNNLRYTVTDRPTPKHVTAAGMTPRAAPGAPAAAPAFGRAQVGARTTTDNNNKVCMLGVQT